MWNIRDIIGKKNFESTIENDSILYELEEYFYQKEEYFYQKEYFGENSPDTKGLKRKKK